MELTSREYKLMLRTDRFSGAESDCRKAVASFWQAAGGHLQKAGVETAGKLEHAAPDKQRRIVFLDTADKALFRQAGLVCRLRRRLDAEEPWTETLKFRHGDRLLSGAQAFRLREKKKKKGKFEEDVKAAGSADAPAFRALFSRSVDARLEQREEVATIGDLLQPFSGLSRLPLPSDDAAVVEVGALRIVEHVYEGGALRLPADVEAESAMIVWWREGEAQSPVAAEFSFRFALEKGAVEVDVAERAWRALSVLHGSDWAVPDGTTKTALVYGGGGG